MASVVPLLKVMDWQLCPVDIGMVIVLIRTIFRFCLLTCVVLLCAMTAAARQNADTLPPLEPLTRNNIAQV
jgi:hypothetical protein